MSAAIGGKTGARPCQALFERSQGINCTQARTPSQVLQLPDPPCTTSVFERQAKHDPSLVGITATALNAKRSAVCATGIARLRAEHWP